MDEEKLARFIADWLAEKANAGVAMDPYINTDDLDSCVVDGCLDLLELSRRILSFVLESEIVSSPED